MFTVRRAARCFVFVLTIAAAGCRNSKPPDILANLPEPQKQFCQILAKNGKSNLDSAIASLGPSAQFAAWHGQGSVRPRGDGKTIAVSFTPACPDASASVTLEDDGSISATDALGSSLQGSDFSQGMMVSGRFIKPASGGAVAQFQLLSPVAFSHSDQPAHAESPSVMASILDSVTGQNQQTRFCKIILNEPIEKKRIETEQAEAAQRNPLNPSDFEARKKAVYPKMFEDLYALVGPSGTFTNWRGQLTARIDNSHGRPSKRVFVVSFVPDCPDANPNSTPVLTLSTAEVHGAATHIDPDSTLGQSMRDLDFSSNRKFTVSGQFIWAPQPPRGSVWQDLDTRYRFYPTIGYFNEGYYDFVVRITSIS